MSENLKLDPRSTAVLLMDIQKGIVDTIEGADKILSAAAEVLHAAREKQATILHVGIGFRPGYPEVSAAHPTFSQIRSTGRFVQGTASAEFHARVAPLQEEVRITKHRVSAFSGSDLEMVLRSKNISTLVLLGIATSGVVLSTLRQASDMDFRCLVVEDACMDRDPEVHRVLMQKVFARQAMVLSSREIVSILSQT